MQPIVTCSDVSIHEISDVIPIHISHGIFSCNAILHGIPADATKLYAMKSFSKSRKSEERDPEIFKKNRQFFRREYELLTSFLNPKTNVAHERIVSAFGYFESYLDYGPLFLMEKGEQSLYDVLKDTHIPTGTVPGCYSFDHCLKFSCQIAEALVYLHGGISFNNEVKPIIHRDLKSCNILLFNQGTECKLCDFDISKPVNVSMTEGAGTKYWRAPEIVNGGRCYTVAADCFSFGAVICETLFRSIPEMIGRIDNVTNPTESQAESDSMVFFLCENVEKVLYLCESTFAETAAYQLRMSQMKELLSGLFERNPVRRSTARAALNALQKLTPPIAHNLTPLYGPGVPRPAIDVGEREMSEPVILENPNASICTSVPSEFISVFYTVEKQPREDFDKFEKDRIRLVMCVMVETLNTLASTSGQPCSAVFCICLAPEEPQSLILEMKIKQQASIDNRREPSVVSWCRDNDARCTDQFKSFFASDPRVSLQSLRFRMRISDCFMPDCEVEKDKQHNTSLIWRSAAKMSSGLQGMLALLENFE